MKIDNDTTSEFARGFYPPPQNIKQLKVKVGEYKMSSEAKRWSKAEKEPIYLEFKKVFDASKYKKDIILINCGVSRAIPSPVIAIMYTRPGFDGDKDDIGLICKEATKKSKKYKFQRQKVGSPNIAHFLSDEHPFAIPYPNLTYGIVALPKSATIVGYESFNPAWYDISSLSLDEAMEVPMVESFVNVGFYPENAQKLAYRVLENNPFMMLHNLPIAYEDYEPDNNEDIFFKVFADACIKTNCDVNKLFEALRYEDLDAVSEGIVNKIADTKTGKDVRRVANDVKHTVSPVAKSLVDTVQNFVKWDAEKDREMVITGSFFLKARYLFKKILMYSVGSSLLWALPFGGIPGLLLKITSMLVLPVLKWKEIFGFMYTNTVGDGQVAPNKVKNRVLQELELELKMTREKIDDAKGAGDKKAKYQLMRVENQIEMEIARIKTNGAV